jgi:hypothetical protein
VWPGRAAIVVIPAIDRGKGANQDDGKELRTSDSESAVEAVAPHEGDLHAVSVDALNATPALTAYHGDQAARHVLGSENASI